MIQFRSIASSSRANCYTLTDGRTPLIIEAGVRLKILQKAIEFTLSNYAGLLVTHGHLDHGRHAVDLMKAGLDCYCSAGAAHYLNVSGNHMQIIQAMEQFKIGTWTVLPFDTKHDCEEPLGFLLASGSEKILFATDTVYIPYRFNGLTHIMVEANYQEEILDENIKNGSLDPARKARLLRSHFSLANVCKMLEANDLSKLREVHLLHLSHENSDESHMRRTIAGLTGVPVYVAGG